MLLVSFPWIIKFSRSQKEGNKGLSAVHPLDCNTIGLNTCFSLENHSKLGTISNLYSCAHSRYHIWIIVSTRWIVRTVHGPRIKQFYTIRLKNFCCISARRSLYCTEINIICPSQNQCLVVTGSFRIAYAKNGVVTTAHAPNTNRVLRALFFGNCVRMQRVIALLQGGFLMHEKLAKARTALANRSCSCHPEHDIRDILATAI